MTKIVVACGFIKDKKILLLERKFEPYKGYWVMPGGKAKFGETIEEASEREFFEETGIKAMCTAIRGFNNELLEKEQDAGFEKIGHFLIFVCQMEAEETTFRESEEGALKWFDLSTLKTLKIIPSDRVMIERFLLSSSSLDHINITMRQQKGEYTIQKGD